MKQMIETKHSSYALDELNRETTYGGEGVERTGSIIPVIDLHDFDNRIDEITESLWQAATEIGFFQVVNHSISLSEIEKTFAASESFFAQDNSVKSQFPLKDGLNAGWEFMEQVRPSTGVADQKESYQLTLPHMKGLWPTNTQVPGFRQQLLMFEYQCWLLGTRILQCFARKLGFEDDFFTRAHDPQSPHYQSTLRLLHYLPVEDASKITPNSWRAGAHTDFDCLTMVFQKPGQGGLQVCAGKDAKDNLAWTSVEPRLDAVTCNIGDMLMRWSDDQLKSTLHRVRMPRQGDYLGPRYSLAFFCQANKDVIIQGPKKTYDPISAQDYLKLRIDANFVSPKT